MARVIDDNVMVCTDCALYIANGELPETDDIWHPPHGHLYIGDSERDEEFSARRCDSCGALPGARFHCVELD